MEPDSTTRHRARLGPGARAVIAVTCGGLLGSAIRYGVTVALPLRAGSFPLALLIVNVAGSLFLGAYSARRARAATASWSLQFWAIGLLGSFTTFSAFSVETVRLVADGYTLMATAYVMASLLAGLTAALLGGRLGEVWR
ncbi:MAG: CrcB family protein [Acidimicrobiia bacterium]